MDQGPRSTVQCWPVPLRNPIRHYDWGSRVELARFQRRPASGLPEAELWLGAHPSGPSTLVPLPEDRHELPRDRPSPEGHGALPGARSTGDTADGLSLADAINADPLGVLGADVVARFGTRLPFLLKVLAIARPLSVQVHPSAARAAEAFADPSLALGGHRYVDPWPKPELLYALRPSEALCGFRPPERTRVLLSLFEGPRVHRLVEALTGGDSPHAGESLLRALVTWPVDDRESLVRELAGSARQVMLWPGKESRSVSPTELRTLLWVRRLARAYPQDPLVAAPLVFDLLNLAPGDSLFVPAGVPHAYLDGFGIEIMGSSDNVLRAGLTPKPIAVDELLLTLDSASRPSPSIPPTLLGPHEVAWRPPVEEFQLTRLRIPEGTHAHLDADVTGPQILLCTLGPVTVQVDGGGTVILGAGASAFLGADAGPCTLSGAGEVFRAAVGPHRSRLPALR